MTKIELSDKQTDFLLNSLNRINVAEGAVRSGKSFIQMVRWMEFVATHRGPFLISGKTRDTISRNVISPLVDLFGPKLVQFKISRGEAILFGKTCYCVGATDDGAETRIRGITANGWLADEVTIHPRSFIHQALARCSMEDSKCFWTCNPDSPYHFIYQDYLQGNPVVSRWHFTLDDNPALDPEYVASLEAMYTGLFYRRFILGEWVLAEGTVYSMFDEGKHVVQENDIPECDEYWVGVDYGITNPCVFLLLGRRDDQYYVVREYYHSGGGGVQKTDSEYGKDMWDFLFGIAPERIYVDPSALSYITELKKRSLRVVGADNSVLPGIQEVSALLVSGQLHISSACRYTIREFASYIWDEKASKNGRDVPRKEHDHCMDALRYAIFSHGKRGGRIMTLGSRVGHRLW